MKVEFLQDGSPDCPLIRIYGNTGVPVQKLGREVIRLCSADKLCIPIFSSEDFERVGELELTLETAEEDLGVVRSEQRFRWCLTRNCWLQVLGLAIPFMEPLSGHKFQWLWRARKKNDVQVLLSNTGEW